MKSYTLSASYALLLWLGGCADASDDGEVDLDAAVNTPLDASAPRFDAAMPALDAATLIDASRVEEPYRLALPAHFPYPKIPADNPLRAAAIELGRHLFYDERLSATGDFSCASCHKQALAFSDERATGLGATGEAHSRSSMSLANVAWSPTLTWANPLMTSLETQLFVPLFGDDPVELGFRSVPELEAVLRSVEDYAALFATAFPGDPAPISMTNAQRALASFQRSLVSADAPYDRYLQGAHDALDAAALRGMRLVTTSEDPRFVCNHCHGGFNFSDHVAWEGLPDGLPPVFHQTGLYDLDGKGTYPSPNSGVHEITLRDEDMGMFKAPTLRNVALTAPYMHDGSIATLGEVLEHYAAGGRAHHAGRTDPALVPFSLSDGEKADVIAFLHSLTDETFIHDPRLANPWTAR